MARFNSFQQSSDPTFQAMYNEAIKNDRIERNWFIEDRGDLEIFREAMPLDNKLVRVNDMSRLKEDIEQPSLGR